MMHLPPAPPSALRPGFLELYTGYLSPPTCISLPTQHFLPCFPTALSTMAPPDTVMGASSVSYLWWWKMSLSKPARGCPGSVSGAGLRGLWC